MLFFPPFFYASTFYRFKYFPSFLKKRQPQILADVPHRINKKNPLPVLLIIKNSNIYPTILKTIEIFINKECIINKDYNIQLRQDYWDNLEDINIRDFSTGFNIIDVKITYKVKNKIYSCYNDNFRTTSHEPLKCYFSEDDLPRLEGFISGDLHYHSNYTDDQIEFGASIQASSQMAKVLGMDFFCITDHSYDLDDYPDNFLKNDPDLNKWKTFLSKVNTYNQQNKKPLIVPGEEISVRNNKNKTVHFLVYNCEQFFEGSGDSGEKWFKYNSQFSINEIIKKIPQNSVAFAAHPSDKIPFSQNLLLNRGQWSVSDAQNEHICGVQIFNGHGENQIAAAITFWKQLLIKGCKSYALAGNDAHGNFGRNRSIAIPFLSIRETYTQLFAQWRTDLFMDKPDFSIEDIINMLDNGNYSLSNGPSMDIKIRDRQGILFSMGQTCESASEIKVTAKSSMEFGHLKKLIIYSGNIQKGIEEPYMTKVIDNNSFFFSITCELKNVISGAYIRAEISSSGPKGNHYAFSNPVWIY